MELRPRQDAACGLCDSVAGGCRVPAMNEESSCGSSSLPGGARWGRTAPPPPGIRFRSWSQCSASPIRRVVCHSRVGRTGVPATGAARLVVVAAAWFETSSRRAARRITQRFCRVGKALAPLRGYRDRKPESPDAQSRHPHCRCHPPSRSRPGSSSGRNDWWIRCTPRPGPGFAPPGVLPSDLPRGLTPSTEIENASGRTQPGCRFCVGACPNSSTSHGHEGLAIRPDDPLAPPPQRRLSAFSDTLRSVSRDRRMIGGNPTTIRRRADQPPILLCRP